MEVSTQPGHVVAGRYRLVAEIDSGGFGRVWQAFDQQLGRTVAVKEVVLPSLPPAQREQRLEQARREGRNAAALADHPNIVTVYDVVIEGGAPWIVMQYVRGRSLHDLLRAHSAAIVPLPVDQVAEIAKSMLAALRCASQSDSRIVHRDIKPANILLSDDGQALLADFGIAKADGDIALTESGVVVGTMAYIAPERAEGQPATPASDLFSLGATLFEAVEGYSAFGRDTATGTLTAILVSPLPPMTRAGRLAPLIQALTAKDPQQRPTVEQAQALLAQRHPIPPNSADAQVKTAIAWNRPPVAALIQPARSLWHFAQVPLLAVLTLVALHLPIVTTTWAYNGQKIEQLTYTAMTLYPWKGLEPAIAANEHSLAPWVVTSIFLIGTIMLVAAAIVTPAAKTGEVRKLVAGISACWVLVVTLGSLIFLVLAPLSRRSYVYTVGDWGTFHAVPESGVWLLWLITALAVRRLWKI